MPKKKTRFVGNAFVSTFENQDKLSKSYSERKLSSTEKAYDEEDNGYNDKIAAIKLRFKMK